MSWFSRNRLLRRWWGGKEGLVNGHSKIIEQDGPRISLARNAGNGTHLKKRLKRGDPGINRLDKIARKHDIDYSNAKTLRDKHEADSKMIRAIEKLPGRKKWPETVV